MSLQSPCHIPQVNNIVNWVQCRVITEFSSLEEADKSSTVPPTSTPLLHTAPITYKNTITQHYIPPRNKKCYVILSHRKERKGIADAMLLQTGKIN